MTHNAAWEWPIWQTALRGYAIIILQKYSTRSIIRRATHQVGCAASMLAAGRRICMAGLEGMRLGAYELIERIGGGGMAEVYRAKQLTAFGREVAIKVIRSGFSEQEDFRTRFLREAQAISRL